MVVVIDDSSWATITDHLPSDVLAEVEEPTAEEEAVEVAASAHDRLDDHDDRLDRLTDKQDRAGDARLTLRQDIEDAVEEGRAEAEAGREDLQQQLDSRFVKLADRLHSLKTADAYESYEGVPTPELSYLERFHHLGHEEGLAGRESPGVYDRLAVIILENFTEWARKRNDGRVVLPVTGLKQRLSHEVARSDLIDKDEIRHNKTVERAFKAVDARMDGKINHVPGDRAKGRKRQLQVAKGREDDVALDLSLVRSLQPTSRDGRQTLSAMM